MRNIVVIRRPVNSNGITLVDRSLPNGRKDPQSRFAANPRMKVNGDLDVLSIRRKYLKKLIFRCLEDAESGVPRAIDYLDLFHHALF